MHYVERVCASDSSNRQKGFAQAYAFFLLQGLVSRPLPNFRKVLLREMGVLTSMSRRNLACSPFIDPSSLLLIGADEIPENLSLEDFARQVDQRETSEGSWGPAFVTLGRRERLRREEADAENTEEGEVSAQTVDSIFSMFISALWNAIPSLEQRLRTPLPDETPAFTRENIEYYIDSPFFRPMCLTRHSRQDRFRWFFPTTAENIPTGGGWSNLLHWHSFLSWQALIARQEDIEALRERFMQMPVLPSGGTRTHIFRCERRNRRSYVLFNV
jgi:hypothetical protein